MKRAYFTLLILISAIVQAGCAKRTTSAITSVTTTDLRVISYNIHHCNPPSKPDFIDVEAIANTISKQNPDLVALQEVDVNTARSGNIDQAKLLAEKLDMNYFFAKAIDHDGGDYGVAILSKFPISEEKIHRLTTQAGTNGEPRVLATVLVDLPNGKKIRFGSTHLDAQRDETNRLLQANELNAVATSEDLPFIIAGDLNAKPGSNTINIFDKEYARTCQDCAFTVPVINPQRTIDFVAYSKKSPFEVVSHEVIEETYASDHLPVLAVLKLKK